MILHPDAVREHDALEGFLQKGATLACRKRRACQDVPDP